MVPGRRLLRGKPGPIRVRDDRRGRQGD
jgi:hypothetical protein